MTEFASNNGVSVRAHKGDAMTLLAFDLDEAKTKNFTGFSVRITPGTRAPFYMYNLLTYPPAVMQKNHISKHDAMTTEFSPIQKFRWVHVPATFHQVNDPFYGTYTYEVTARYLVGDVLQPLDPSLTVKVSIDVSPFQVGDLQIGFTRGFVSSQAYVNHFGENGKVRPNQSDLIFDIKAKSGPVKPDEQTKISAYTFADQFEWMGWQARARILEFLDATLADPSLALDVFAFDLDEPVICDRLLTLARQGRLRILLDDSSTHTGQDKDGNAAFEDQFAQLFSQQAVAPSALVRGRFQALAHSKVFIQKIKADNTAVKVLTGSTNFSTNGLYINANHVLIFNNQKVAKLYADVFQKSFSKPLMTAFKSIDLAMQDHVIGENNLPNMTIRFSPHTLPVATDFFKIIADRIKAAQSDVLFAIMKDNSAGSILDAIRFVREKRDNDIFSYGVTDTTKTVTLYKPHTRNGVLVAGKGGAHVLPPPFDEEIGFSGIAIHHKFVVVDFKGANPVVWCGSSNLAFGPEQRNGDNLIEIRDRVVVTVFAIEAIRLVDHFHFRDRTQNQEAMNLEATASADGPWYASYYDETDLHFVERTLLISGAP
ncbi:MAG: phospholipase D-like domain-containing protein [Chthoniobacter sp.]|uniref:phospholipase D-like domain-containing protein n=1 Tax=Chthoniobacter sp. TaxID=2510640 RepID=UPI0032A5D900